MVNFYTIFAMINLNTRSKIRRVYLWIDFCLQVLANTVLVSLAIYGFMNHINKTDLIRASIELISLSTIYLGFYSFTQTISQILNLIFITIEWKKLNVFSWIRLVYGFLITIIAAFLLLHIININSDTMFLTSIFVLILYIFYFLFSIAELVFVSKKILE
jgi:hypothetical protein